MGAIHAIAHNNSFIHSTHYLTATNMSIESMTELGNTDINGEVFALVAMLNYYRTAKRCPFDIQQAVELYLERRNESPTEAIARLNSYIIL